MWKTSHLSCWGCQAFVFLRRPSGEDWLSRLANDNRTQRKEYTNLVPKVCLILINNEQCQPSFFLPFSNFLTTHIQYILVWQIKAQKRRLFSKQSLLPWVMAGKRDQLKHGVAPRGEVVTHRASENCLRLPHTSSRIVYSTWAPDNRNLSDGAICEPQPANRSLAAQLKFYRGSISYRW